MNYNKFKSQSTDEKPVKKKTGYFLDSNVHHIRINSNVSIIAKQLNYKSGAD